eukprot:COSAG01_NODE_14015_length_1507_cov_1.482955_2_plen_137_part_00
MTWSRYGASGEVTCAKREGNLYHEALDAQQLADWKVDYYKYDACGEDNLQAFAKFQVMRDALNRTGRSIVYTIVGWEQPSVWPSYNGNSWRISSDIKPSYGKVLASAHAANAWIQFGGPGHWPDVDMYVTGPPLKR